MIKVLFKGISVKVSKIFINQLEICVRKWTIRLHFSFRGLIFMNFALGQQRSIPTT